MNAHTTVEEPSEAVFSMWSILKLYNKDQQDQVFVGALPQPRES
jgi:hypothetical protein